MPQEPATAETVVPTATAEDRERIIVRTSALGIATNILLTAFKAAVGLASNSIAVVLDAVNNLSDALSSVITIVGAKLGSREPDRKHPMGYGRIEYLSSMLVSAIVLYAGITSLVESVKKVISPEAASYDTTSVVIIAVAVVAKILLGRHTRRQGELANSGALVASGSDALFDAVLSASVLASALVQMATGISLEAYVGIAISVVIVKAGIEMMRETLDDLIGKREDIEVTRKVKALLAEDPEVHGAYDLALFNYGPDRYYGSVHLELDDTLTVDEVDRIIRRAERKVYKEMGITLTGVSVYSRNTKDDDAAKMRDRIRETVTAHDWALQMHGFYVDMEVKEMRFDVVLSFSVDRKEALSVMRAEVEAMYPGYDIQIVPDIDFSD